MTQAVGRNIASASWGDHLTFGEGDGLLDTPEALRRRMELWRDELGAGTVHWRQERTGKEGKLRAAREYQTCIPPMPLR